MRFLAAEVPEHVPFLLHVAAEAFVSRRVSALDITHPNKFPQSITGLQDFFF